MSYEDTTPALTPPDGFQTNFVDPPTIASAIIAGLTVCLGLSTISALLRVFAQWYLFKKLIWADFWTLLAWAGHVAFAGFLYACIPYGAGRHQWNVNLTNYYNIKFLLFVDFVIYDVAITGAKVAILLQLKAIFAGTGQRNRFYWSIVVIIFINIAFYVALSFALIFQCTPISKGWDAKIDGTCLDQDSLLASSGPFNIVSDFMIFLLPIYAIWQLQLPIRKRIEVCCAFAVGLFGCICSAVRLVYSERLNVSGDETTLIFENQLWAGAEITAGILIANAMILPRFIRNIRGNTDTSFSYPTDGRYARGTGNRQSHGRPLSGWPGSPRTITRGGTGMREPWIELHDSDGVALAKGKNSVSASAATGTVVSGNSDRDGDNSSLEEPTYGGIVKTIQIETRSEAISPGSRVNFSTPRPLGLPIQRHE